MAPRLQPTHPRTDWRVALVGNPNCGKTALFNLLTGARQKVANYAGVTVERKAGTARLHDGRTVTVIDLPGAYSLDAGHARRAGDAGGDRGPARGRKRARPDRRRGRCHQPAHEPAPGAGAAAPRPADAGGAEHGRRGAPRRAWPSTCRGWRSELGCAGGRDRGGAPQRPCATAAADPGCGSAAPRDRQRRRRRAARPGATAARGAAHPGRRGARRAAVATLPHAHRRAGDAPGVGPAAAGGAAVPDVPGGVLLGRRADGRDQGRRWRAWATGRWRTWPTAHCAACWSTASSPASAACWCSCRRS